MKDEAFKAYKEYEAWCHMQQNAQIKVLHSDRGGKYMGAEFVNYLKAQGMEQRLTMHDTPAHNGIAEHRNHTILEHIRALLHASRLPCFLWGEAAHHIVLLMNCISTKAVE